MKKVLYLLLLCTTSLVVSCKKEADREQFIGTYNVSQSCGGGQNSNYQITISESGEGESVSINNFANLGFQVKGVCNGTTIVFTPQTGTAPVDGTPVTFNTSGGEGTLNNGVLTIPFSFTGSNGWAATCTMSCSQQ